MTFPNALTGVNKIYKAEVLAIVGAILSLLAILFGLIGGFAAVLAVIFIIAAVVLLIIAFFKNISGVKSAAKDDGAFQKALIMLIVGIATSLLSSAFSGNQILAGICSFLSKAADAMSSYFICTGIINLADRLDDAAVSEKGKKTRSFVLVIFMASALLSLISSFFGNSGSVSTAFNVISIISLVISIVAYVMYLGVLKSASVMLEK